MIHYMTLVDFAFKAIKNKTKTIEMRLNDEKRRVIRIGDMIEFTSLATNEKVNVIVINLHKYDSFESLYPNFDKISLGYREDEIKDPKDMNQFYSDENIKKYGVLGIEIKVID